MNSWPLHTAGGSPDPPPPSILHHVQDGPAADSARPVECLAHRCLRGLQADLRVQTKSPAADVRRRSQVEAGYDELGRAIAAERGAVVRLLGDHRQEMRRLAEASNAQNEQITRLSSWARSRSPTLIGTVYRMNSRHMPELGWRWGYPFALLLMAVVCGGLYLIFTRRGWL